MLEGSGGLTEIQMEHLGTIISSGEHLLDLISNIIDHSRLESNAVSIESIPFDFRELCETAIESMATIAHGKSVDLCLASSIKTDPPPLFGDPTRIRQVLINLVSNAVKFSSEGTVTVAWRYEALGESGDNVLVSLDVADTGIGIPADSKCRCETGLTTRNGSALPKLLPNRQQHHPVVRWKRSRSGHIEGTRSAHGRRLYRSQ